ncbi:MAG TPA: hypothetical protein VFO46_21610 [Candidatus Sulfotelmatobacter sp.]|nr:hypothetical protein [Candidatus Sulfotelmatobacter sp.]
MKAAEKKLGTHPPFSKNPAILDELLRQFLVDHSAGMDHDLPSPQH